MTERIIAYRNRSEAFNDSIFGFLVNFTLYAAWKSFPVALRAFKGFVIVSAPVLLIGTVTAPSGVHRLEHGAQLVGEQHKFLWSHLGGGIKNIFGVAGQIVGPVLDNGSTETTNPLPKTGS